MTRLCILDCDGTLVDSLGIIVSSMREAFRHQGLDAPPATTLKRVIGLSLTAALAELLPGHSPSVQKAVAAGYKDAYSHARRNTTSVIEPLYPGTLEALDEIERRGWILALATGKTHRGAMATLASHGLESRFVSVQTADSAASKPAPEMILNAMRDAGASIDSTVMVGDTIFDMSMARNAGAVAVGVTWGYHSEQDLLDAGAHQVIQTFAEMPHALDTWVCNGQ